MHPKAESLTRIAAALRKTTETLAHELAFPTDNEPCWTEFEWQIARAASAMHGVSSLLHDRLRWQGPEHWRRFLGEQRRQSVARHGLIAGLLKAIDRRAQAEGVPIVALKGAALHASRIYAAGERPMGDIDLLVTQDNAQEIDRVLLHACDYELAFTTHRHRVFQPRIKRALTDVRVGEHIDNTLKIEVHTRIAEQLPVTAADITPYLLPKPARAGLNPYPSAAALMLHLLLHAAGNMRARALRLIQLHDIATLAPRLTAADWEVLHTIRPDGRANWWAWAPLALTSRYYPATIPPGTLAHLRAECPWLLGRLAGRQQLVDVSWSNLRIEAFPGVEWSRTPREAFKFMGSRIWPSREARMELREGAAQIPASATVPWYGVSHGARILRWLFTRPPRVQTLLSVRAALSQYSDESSTLAAH
jgi:hypothetical protein